MHVQHLSGFLLGCLPRAQDGANIGDSIGCFCQFVQSAGAPKVVVAHEHGVFPFRMIEEKAQIAIVPEVRRGREEADTQEFVLP